MPWRVIHLSLPLVLAACAGAPDQDAETGRLSFERDGATLIEGGATGSRCAANGTVAIVAIGGEWVAAVALRTTWPVDSIRELPVVAAAGVPGSASLAARPVSDSVGLAVIATRGVVRLEPGATLSGRFDAGAPTQPGAPDSVHLTGTFEGVRIAEDLCPAGTTRSGGSGPTD